MSTYDRTALLEQLGAHGGNGAKTKLTEADWLTLAAKRHGAFVLVVDEHVVAEGRWLKMLGQFLISTHAGDRVKVVSHTDYVMRRVAEAALVAL